MHRLHEEQFLNYTSKRREIRVGTDYGLLLVAMKFSDLDNNPMHHSILDSMTFGESIILHKLSLLTIETLPSSDEVVSHYGMKLSKKGYQFVEEKIKFPRFTIFLKGKIIDTSFEKIDIKEALKGDPGSLIYYKDTLERIKS